MKVAIYVTLLKYYTIFGSKIKNRIIFGELKSNSIKNQYEKLASISSDKIDIELLSETRQMKRSL